MQQLQLDVKRQACTYTETVKCGSGSKHKQYAEHHKNRQHKGRTRREKKTIMVSLMPPLPPLIASTDESPNAHNSFCQRDKIQVAGSRKIWGTLKSTTTSAVSNAVCSLTGMNAHHLIFKHKYNPTKNSSKWWFVIRSDEALLKNLEEKWHLIALQTNWKIEPVLRFSYDSDTTSLNHEDPPTEFEAGTSSDTQLPSDAFLGNK